MLFSSTIAVFRVQNAFNGIAAAFQGGRYSSNASYPATRKKHTYSHQPSKELFKTSSYICYLHFASPPAFLVHIYKPKPLFSPSEAVKCSRHHFPCKTLLRCINIDTDSYSLNTSPLSPNYCLY